MPEPIAIKLIEVSFFKNFVKCTHIPLSVAHIEWLTQKLIGGPFVSQFLWYMRIHFIHKYQALDKTSSGAGGGGGSLTQWNVNESSQVLCANDRMLKCLVRSAITSW